MIVRHQIFRIPDDLNLDKITAPQLPSQTGDSNRLLGGAGAERVGQERDPLRDIVQNIFLASLIRPAKSKSHNLRFPSLYDIGHF